MASSNVFRSSPVHGPRRDSLGLETSSPGLPPLQDILSQRYSRPPPRSGSKAISIPGGASANFISASSLFNSTGMPSARPAQVAGDSMVEQPRSPDLSDSSVEIIQITKPRKSRGTKGALKAASGVKKPSQQKSTKGEKKGKQPQAKADTNEGDAGNLNAGSKARNTKLRATKKKGTTSEHFEPAATAEPSLSTKPKEANVNEPLNLEPAGTRRLNWTPPAQKIVINLDSGSSALKHPASSEIDIPRAPVFKDLVHGYSCIDQIPQSASTVPSDEETSFLKKRKRIELVAIRDGNAVESDILQKSPTKKKAPKKKARTITELATAAYRNPSLSDETPPSPSILDHFPPENADSGTANETTKQGKGKANARKRPSKASKKKAPPPKPILLSPGAALDQAARQDYVFGTSSQLAREPSPSVLRDIQAALKHPNEPEYVDVTTMINSDGIEPSERRSRLWDAAARDAEGDLFDVEVVDLVEGSPQLPMANRESDPFGYFGGGAPGETHADRLEVVPSDAAASFVNLSDILPSPGEKAIQIDGDSPYFSESDLSTSTNICAPRSPQLELPRQSAAPKNPQQQDSVAVDLPLRPDFDALTDVQLAKEIKTYGFKPIKRRTAMIAMLDQCWQSKVRLGQVGIHTSITRSTAASTSTRAESSAAAASPGKKPRGRPRKGSATASKPQDPPPTPSPQKKSGGRPRKNSINASEPQEPPPSAQPPETPKRPRGRPRKDSLCSPSTTSPRPKAKSISPKKSSAAHSPSRRKKCRGPVVEIPDSASENGTDLASSPSSTIEQMFSSPPPLDLSLSTADENEQSLLASPDDQHIALFDHITKAIKSAPRTKDPENPSWHEKILLYDPLVLEDLATWLNSGELTRVGCDTEVSPGEVKQWCESKSICCLMKVNLRGKQRKRF
ncbi:hypothetical protein B0T10DRAFT_554986 [Thelonectria olida]|uniref:Structure-specific endonuclease subunit SLX4 n=1 Tax=Thelonectria olida TaxID=1576542 RepID=A0A9P9AU15_9HYPO|nr:hypothetical protein B0T10DRAFT_554986 [Thelonectria olida]